MEQPAPQGKKDNKALEKDSCFGMILHDSE
jgi:hypothetical protein